MTNRYKLVRVTALMLAATVLCSGFIYLFFPASQFDIVIERLLEPQGLKLSPAVHKTLLPGLAWDNLQLSTSQGTLVHCDRLQIKPHLLQLFKGRAVISGTADIGNGHLGIKYALNGKDALDLTSIGINLSELPFFKTVLGARVAGAFWCQGKLLRGTTGLSGDVKVEVRQLEFSGVKLGAFTLPDVAGIKTQGMVKVADNRVRLESFTLEGDGIYMRVSGDLPFDANAAKTPLNLILEIMPKPDFLEKQKLVFMLLTKFMVSPGVYKMPIKGTILKPEIL